MFWDILDLSSSTRDWTLYSLNWKEKSQLQASWSITVSWTLFKLMALESVMPSNHLILSCPFLLLPPIFPSIRVFSKESALWIRWPQVLINSCWIGGALQCRGSRVVGLDVAHSRACALVGRVAWGHGCPACSSGEGRAPGEEGRHLEREKEEEEEGKGETSLSVQFSHSVVSNSLRPHGLKHARPPCPSLTPRVYSNSCPLSQWCHPTHLVLCCPLLLLPSIFPSIRVFSNESALRIRWSKYWSFSFSISPSNEYSGLFSFKMDWLDLLAVQGTLESSPTPQFKSINFLALSFLYKESFA